MSKVIFLDTETSGLRPFKHSPWNISGIIEVRGEVKQEFDIHCQPVRLDNVSPEALEKTNMTIDKLKEFQPAEKGYKELLNIWNGTVDRYNKEDKMTVVGHNVGFDTDMLYGWFKGAFSDPYLYSYIEPYYVDTYRIACWLKAIGKIGNIENLQLETLCRYFNIIDDDDKGEFHESALYDVKLNKKLYERFNEFLKSEF
jgi:DNA polymerase-3 subunit epsilon